jgi:hypothetical protein
MEITNYLTECVTNHKPVSFSKYGDGEFDCIFFPNPSRSNADKDCFTDKLSIKLRESFKYMVDESENSYIGLWHNKERIPYFESIVNKQIKWANYHSIIFDKTNDVDKVELIKAIKNSKVKKIIICNELLIKSKLLLDADDIIIVNFNNWFDSMFENIVEQIKNSIGEDEKHIIITCCGLGAKVLICEFTKHFKNGIYLDFGSALDFLCTKRDSRGFHFNYNYLTNLLEDILPDEWNHNRYNYIYEAAKTKLGIHLPQETINNKNIVLISSVINTPNLPLSYIDTRSIYNHKERFEQTKKTINTVRNKMPNNIICLIECSPLEKEETDYLKNYTDIFINLYDINDASIVNNVFSISKSLGEGAITTYALKYLIENNIEFDNFYKLSGRYWLNSNFEYNLFDNNKIIVKKINNDSNNLITCLYKLPKNYIHLWLNFLMNSINDMNNCIGAEFLFAKFINTVNDNEKIFVEKIGVSGNVAVCGTLIEQ